MAKAKKTAATKVAAKTAPAPSAQMPDDSARARAREVVEEAAAVWVATDSLIPWAKNPRKNDKAVAEVAKSIKRFGFASPIIARKEDGEIIAGHTRLAAAQKLKLPRVPVRYLDLDPGEAHLLALADNKIGEIAGWDDHLLVEVLSQYTREDAGAAGFTDADLDKLAGSLAEEGDADVDDTPKVFGVVIECKDEREQVMLLSSLSAQGLQCRALM